MAQQLAANEQARVERILSRHLRHYRRSQRHSDRASYVLNPAAAAAVATGDEVSDAVRALQFQDIDENDFDTLLTLDEQGGVGGRNCAGRRGLDEDVLRGLLGPWTGTATGEEELCSICLDDYGENKKVWLQNGRSNYLKSDNFPPPVSLFFYFVGFRLGKCFLLT